MYMASDKKTLAIVTGSRGVVGREYLNILSSRPNTTCLAISRSKIENLAPKITQVNLDLVDKAAVEKAFIDVSLSTVEEIIFIHSVGKFKFEPAGLPEIDLDQDGIDDEVYQTNIETFLNILNSLLPKIEKERSLGRELNLALCGLGSISDKYQVAYWSSYTKTKNQLRSIIYNLIQEKPDYIRGLFINVSTVDTENENELRPNADKTYWLKGLEIAQASLPFIIEQKNGSWKQVDIFKESPFFQDGYYENLEEVRIRWAEQMKEKSQNENQIINESNEGIDSQQKIIIRDASNDLFGGPSFK